MFKLQTAACWFPTFKIYVSAKTPAFYVARIKPKAEKMQIEMFYIFSFHKIITIIGVLLFQPLPSKSVEKPYYLYFTVCFLIAWYGTEILGAVTGGTVKLGK